jgi:hypothetical protein
MNTAYSTSSSPVTSLSFLWNFLAFFTHSVLALTITTCKYVREGERERERGREGEREREREGERERGRERERERGSE